LRRVLAVAPLGSAGSGRGRRRGAGEQSGRHYAHTADAERALTHEARAGKRRDHATADRRHGNSEANPEHRTQQHARDQAPRSWKRRPGRRAAAGREAHTEWRWGGAAVTQERLWPPLSLRAAAGGTITTPSRSLEEPGTSDIAHPGE